MLRALDTAHGHRSPFRCEGVRFQSPKAVSVTLKENYSIPEHCLGMRDMLKKFKGKGAASVPAPGTFGLRCPPPPPQTLGHGEFFSRSFIQLVPVWVLMSSGRFHGGETFLALALDGL